MNLPPPFDTADGRQYPTGTGSNDEGWYMGARDFNDGLTIRANPSGAGSWPAPFATNQEAIEFVRRRAEEGSALHQLALEWHIATKLAGPQT